MKPGAGSVRPANAEDQRSHDNNFCFGPTHEEVITDIARREIRSYRQLPVNFYQIQTKFRDEVRPRFGVMRAREFVMKDAYSFHADYTSLEHTYQAMHDTTAAFLPASACYSAPSRRTLAQSAAAARMSFMCWRIPVKTRWLTAPLRIMRQMWRWLRRLLQVHCAHQPHRRCKRPSHPDSAPSRKSRRSSIPPRKAY